MSVNIIMYFSNVLRRSGQHICYIDGCNFVSTYGSVLFSFLCIRLVHLQFVLNMSLFFVHTHRRNFRF